MAILNLESLTLEASQALCDLDRTFIGTENYMGIAYFWAYEYRFPMRDVTIAMRKKIHGKLLKAGLKVDEESDAHKAIIMTYRLTKIAVNKYI
jgi:hypothetical protein